MSGSSFMETRRVSGRSSLSTVSPGLMASRWATSTEELDKRDLPAYGVRTFAQLGEDEACERAVISPESTLFNPPYNTVMKPYGEALANLARGRGEIICLGADLTRQTETDIFRDSIPDRFINVG